jgi:hypothetical protein
MDGWLIGYLDGIMDEWLELVWWDIGKVACIKD